MEAQLTLTQFQALPGKGAVDSTAGTICGVSVMTIGPALGHGILIDREGLQQCLAACQSRGDVRMILRHDGEFEDIVGSICNFRIEGDKVIGDARLFENHPRRDYVLEVAEKIPTEFGLSVEADAQHIDNPAGEGKLFRCSMVDAIALVPRPAANRRGLFSAVLVDKPTQATRSQTHFSKKMSNLKTALTKFAKLCKLQEGDPLDNVIDEVVEAVSSDSPSVEDRLKKLEEALDPKKEEALSARLAKLEEADEKEDDAKLEDEKKDEEKMEDAPADEKKDEEKTDLAKLAEDAATKAVTRLSREFGLTKPAVSGEGFIPSNDLKSKFEAAIATQLSAGAGNRAVAVVRLAKDRPDIYNAAREARLF